MKTRWKVLIGIAVALVVIVVAVILSLDSIVKVGIEKGGTAALGANTTVKSAGISVLGGSAEIKGLAVANPEGFGSGDFLDLGRAAIIMRVRSLLSSTVEVESIILEQPVLKLKQEGLKSNLSVILANAKGKPAEGAKPAPGAKAKPSGRSFKIGLIKITGAKFEYSLGGMPAAPLPLPDIELKDLSNADGTPLLLGDVFRQIIEAMAKSAVQVGGKILPDAIKGPMSDVLKGGAQVIKGGVEGAEGAVKGIGGLIKGIGKKD